MKKLSKLVLRKEVIANLSNRQMNQLKGGDCSLADLITCTNDGTFGGGVMCDTVIRYDCKEETRYTYPNGPTNSGVTTPSICCEYGCCETIGC